MFLIPSRENRNLVQTNRSSFLGNLWSSFNLDLQSNLGVIRLSRKLRLNVSTADDADFGLPCAFAHFDGRFWTIAGTRVFKNAANTIINSLSTEDSSTGSQTDYDPDQSDLAIYDSRLWSTTVDALYSKVSNASGTGAWTARDVLGSGVHWMEYFKKFDRLYYIDNEVQIKSIDATNTAADPGSDYAIDISDSSGNIQCFAANSSAIWIGTLRNITSTGADSTQGAVILEWDGLSSQVTREYKIDAQGVLAICIDKNDVPYVLDSNGILLKYSGYSFQEIGRLPLEGELLLNAIAASGWPIHPNGMIATKDGTIQVLVNGAIANFDASNRPLRENLPSGIWEWSEKNGFIHKQSITYTPVTVTGTEVTDIKDFGQLRLEAVGALANANLYSVSTSGRSLVICGAQYYTDATTTTYGCFVDSPSPTNITATSEGKKFGYFVTSWVLASDLQDMWKKFYIRYKQLLNSSDKIILKYRTREATAVEVTITWTTATSFETSTNISSYVGYEVEVLNGNGAGKCAHISSVSESAGTYTANLDESFVGATSGTAKARIQNWKKITSVSNQTTESNQFPLGIASERIQIKCAAQFTGDDEIFELAIINSQHEKLE